MTNLKSYLYKLSRQKSASCFPYKLEPSGKFLMGLIQFKEQPSDQLFVEATKDDELVIKRTCVPQSHVRMHELSLKKRFPQLVSIYIAEFRCCCVIVQLQVTSSVNSLILVEV